MSGTTWSRFFWSDWESDPALRVCSLAAQGLWMRLLCIAAKHDPTGYVAVNGRPLVETDIARLAGVSEPQVRTLLEELAQNGVFSRNRNGCIYSRRIVRDAKKAKKSKNNGSLGGNPTLSKQRGIRRWVNPPVNPEDKTQYPVSHIPKYSTSLSKNEVQEMWLSNINRCITQQNGGDLSRAYELVEAFERGEKWAVDRVNEIDKKMREKTSAKAPEDDAGGAVEPEQVMEEGGV